LPVPMGDWSETDRARVKGLNLARLAGFTE
jgi:hypothetical protein